MAHVLIIDDRPGVRAVLAQPIRRAGHDVHEAGSVRDGLGVLRSSRCEVVFVGSRRRPEDGDVMTQIRAEAADAAVIVFSCSGNVPEAVQAIKAGAHDYLQLPIEPDTLVRLLRSALDEHSPAAAPALASASGTARRHARPPADHAIAADTTTKLLFEKVRRVAEVDCTVLITGESGTGKEVVAWTIFEQSRRRAGRFIPVNCGAIPDTLAESELFGHHKGAFTGATADKPGLLEEAEDGVLFLDEIGEMSPRLQVTLLRFLDSGELRRVGDTSVRHVNTRIIAATNRPLDREVQQGGFRHDLFYRLSVVSLQVPALRERRDDIPALAHHFLRRSVTKLRKDVRTFTSEALEMLRRYEWPGNVRELQNVVEGAVVLTSDREITRDALPLSIADPTRPYALAPRASEVATAAAVVERFGGNHTQAAAALGVSRTTLWRRLRRTQAGSAPVGAFPAPHASAIETCS